MQLLLLTDVGPVCVCILCVCVCSYRWCTSRAGCCTHQLLIKIYGDACLTFIVGTKSITLRWNQTGLITISVFRIRHVNKHVTYHQKPNANTTFNATLLYDNLNTPLCFQYYTISTKPISSEIPPPSIIMDWSIKWQL